jgi:hypothetical protein
MNVGDPLPTLRGEFLTGRTVVLPQAAAGRVALLLLGFSYDSDPARRERRSCLALCRRSR